MARRPRLRTRVTFAFALVVLVVAGVLAVATWNLAAQYGHRQRERTAQARTTVAAALADQTLRTRPGELGTLLAGLGGDPEATVLVRHDGRWSVTGRPVDPDAVPDDLLDQAGSGTVSARAVEVGGLPVVAAVAPLHGGDVLVDLAPLTELRSTLRFLGWLLLAGVVLAATLAALLGWWTTGRALRPLDRLRHAASRVAAGDLDARLPRGEDADLDPLAATFNTTADELQERVRRDARFAGNVSHELRSPLTTMVGAADLLSHRRHELGAEATEAVDLLAVELHRFTTTVNDLLEISRLDDQPDARDLEPLDLAELVTAVADRFDDVPAPTVTGLATPPAPGGGAPVVHGDRRRLERVVTNLCENARHHGGGVVRLGVHVDADHARLEVDDAGPGIDPAHREAIFERFHRDRSDEGHPDRGGSGLGLALVAGYVHQHAGRVDAGDRPGGGTRITVTLPLALG